MPAAATHLRNLNEITIEILSPADMNMVLDFDSNHAAG